MTDILAKIIIKALVVLSLIEPISYYEEVEIINDKNEKIHSLVVNMNLPNITVENRLSFEHIYGLQSLSEMTEGAKYAVNGMFYSPLGEPYGSIIEDCELVKVEDRGLPKLIIDNDNHVYIGYCKLSISVESGDRVIDIASANALLHHGQVGLYNSYYGKTTRVRGLSSNYIINDGKIEIIKHSEMPIKIKKGRTVLTTRGDTSLFEVGDEARIILKNDKGIDGIKTLCSLGAMLVEDGKNVALDYDLFIGRTYTNQPRTAVGIDKNNFLFFVVVDGRSNESKGVSGRELADIMLAKGCVQAAYLDGGASSEMISDGKIVSKLYKDEERAIAHGLIVCDILDKAEDDELE